jgi:general secretion pathway protein G
MLSIRTHGRRRSTARGFTLVEILIVVIILGILAAIVIPQFTNASTDAKKSNMASQDQTCKSQIALYMLQHNDKPPALGTAGTDADWKPLTSATLVDGTELDAATAAADATATPVVLTYGPYLPQPPVNPLTGVSTLVAFTPGAPATAATTNGWEYDAATGEFHGCDTAGNMSDDGTNDITQ